jgi:hypothetical protein
MLAYLFVVLAVAVRLLPHPFSFTPVGASLLFFGARGPRKHAWIPVLLLAGSDVLLTRFQYGYPLTLDHLATWAWYAAVIALGTLLRDNARPLRIVGASLATAVSFFALSNFAVWSVWEMYPKNLGGLAACYLAGIPFFRNELVSDVLFTAVMFSIPALLQVRKPAPVKVAAD